MCFECCHHLSSVGTCGTFTRCGKSIDDDPAANPQRAGVTKDSWLRPKRPVTGIPIPPQSTNCDMIDTTSSGMICSLELARADSSRPSIADATQVAATVRKSENVALPKKGGCAVGAPLPSRTMAVAIAAWIVAKTEKTRTLAKR